MRILMCCLCCVLLATVCGCAPQLQHRVIGDTGYQIEKGLFAIRSGVSAKAAEDMTFHISPLESILEPVDVNGGTTVRLFESDVVVPEEVTSLFAGRRIIAAPPPENEYVKLGWISLRLRVSEYMEDATALPDSLSRICWKSLAGQDLNLLQRRIDNIVAVSAEYGGDAIINIRIVRQITGVTTTGTLKSRNLWLEGDLICMK